MITTVDAPERADGLQLVGTMVGSGYRTPPSLVRRGDGQTLQLTSLLYLVLEAIDGKRDHAEIAAVVSRALQRAVPEDVVTTLVDEHLRPMGLLKLHDGRDPQLKRSDPLLGLRFRVRVTDPRVTRRITDPFRILFRPVPVALVVLAFFAITWWVFFDHGLAPAAYDAFQRPQLLLLVFVVTVLSGGFHEFGHAAAARYGGANPGTMGAGVYLVWPAFFTDVTDSYRLGRGGRIRTDLGGLYFNAIVVVLTFATWYFTGWDAVLLLVGTQTLQMVQQLLPLFRFDGYHLLADLTGVPDLYNRLRPTLLGLLPHRWRDPENRVLKPWARVVITAWVFVTIPMMALMLLAAIAAVPRLLGSAWAVVSEDAAGVAAAWEDGGPIDIVAHTLQVLAVVLPLLGCLLILGRLGVRWSRGLAIWGRGSFYRRVLAAAVASVAVTSLSWAWWPNPGTYAPIGPDDQSLFTTVFQGTEASGGAARPAASLPAVDAEAEAARADFEQRLSDSGPLEATFPTGGTLPTEAEPQVAIVLVPTDGGEDPTTDTPTPGEEPPEPWVFPFNEPLPPGEGDNQAAAYNTTDDSVTYDVAFALVWATDDEVLNVNEAHAYASCSNCATVAIAYQIVLVVGDAHVVAPQNLAVAANYECYACITVAIAQQLVLSLPSMPTDAEMVALADIWAQLDDLAANIASYPLHEVLQHLDEIQAQVIEVLGVSTAPTATSSASSASASPTGSPTGGAGATTTPPATESSPSPTDAGSPTSSASPSAEPTSAAPSPSAEPTATSSP